MRSLAVSHGSASSPSYGEQISINDYIFIEWVSVCNTQAVLQISENMQHQGSFANGNLSRSLVCQRRKCPVVALEQFVNLTVQPLLGLRVELGLLVHFQLVATPPRHLHLVHIADFHSFQLLQTIFSGEIMTKDPNISNPPRYQGARPGGELPTHSGPPTYCRSAGASPHLPRALPCPAA